MGMQAGNKGEATPYINMTPLIDVLLVLLIIFMVITPLKPHEFETKVPEKPPEKLPENVIPDPLTLVVALTKNLDVELNSTKMTRADLATKLKEELERRPVDKRSIFIKAPKSLPYREIVRVIDICKGAGADPIGLQIDYLE